MYRDLHDKHKHREAHILETDDYLYFSFEFKGSALPFNKNETVDKKVEFFGGEIRIQLEQNNKFIAQVYLKEPNLELLYQTALILAYIVGKNVCLQYYIKAFPYYPSDHHFNLHTSSPTSSALFRILLEKPTETITKLLELLKDEKSYFHRLVIGIMQVNVFPYPEFCFVYEHGLLQGLARENPISGLLFTKEKNPEELGQLESFSSEISELLEKKYPKISKAIKNKLTSKKLNERGSSKEQIKILLGQFESKFIRDYAQCVDDWSDIRSKTSTVHGGKALDINDQKIQHSINALHELLLEIISDEIKRKNGL